MNDSESFESTAMIGIPTECEEHDMRNALLLSVAIGAGIASYFTILYMVAWGVVWLLLQGLATAILK